MDNDSQDNFQDENVITQLICEIEQRLNRLALTLHFPSEPIEDVLDKYTET